MKALILLLLLWPLAQRGFAQTSSGITITVTDEAGEDLIGYPVKVYQSGREVMTVYTDDDGEATARPMAPNEYEVRCRKDTFTRSVRVWVGLAETATVRLDFGTRPPILQTVCGGCGGRPKPIPIWRPRLPTEEEEILLEPSDTRIGQAVTAIQPRPMPRRAASMLRTSSNSTLTAEQLEALPVR